MDASTSGGSPDFLPDGTRGADRDGERNEDAVTLQAFVAALHQGALRTRVLLPLLLTLTVAAGWMNALSYLAVGRVFASFMTGNILFVGLSIAQGNAALLLRASVALLFFFASITLGSRYLEALPARQPAGSWRRAFARYLLVEGLILLAFALLWSLAGNFAQHPAVQVILLSFAAFGMGLQGALLGIFNILDVNPIALTGTELLLGMRLAQQIGRRSADQPVGTSTPILLALMLSYTLAALVVALAVSWSGTAFIPCLLVMAGALVARVGPMEERRSRRT
jgi:uncharacterized membrane protein YoaK (UPF0700 family)